MLARLWALLRGPGMPRRDAAPAALVCPSARWRASDAPNTCRPLLTNPAGVLIGMAVMAASLLLFTL